MGRTRKTIISLDGERRSIPTLLVETVGRDFDVLDSIRVYRKQSAALVDLGETVVLRADKAAELGLEFDPTEHTAADYAGQVYAVARDDAEETGGGRYVFSGLKNTGKHAAEEIWKRAFKVTPEGDGSVVSEEEQPTAAILSSAASTVERFGALATNAVAQLLEQQKTTMEGLVHLRTQIMEQASIMRGLDEARREAGQDLLAHEQAMKRTEMLGGALLEGFKLLAPQLAEVAKNKKEQGSKKDKEPDTTPPEPSTETSGGKPCAEAGELARALTRSPKHHSKLRAMFEAPAWAAWERAMEAPTRDELDQALADVISHTGGAESQLDLMARGMEWRAALDPAEVERVSKILLAAGQRLSFPIEKKVSGSA